MAVGGLRDQHHAEGVPVQPRHGMKGAFLPGPLVIAHHRVGQRPGVPAAGGVDEDPRSLVHRQNVFILIQYRQGEILAGVCRFRLVQQQGYGVSQVDIKIRPLGHSVDQNPLIPFEPVHQSRGDPHFIF